MRQRWIAFSETIKDYILSKNLGVKFIDIHELQRHQGIFDGSKRDSVVYILFFQKSSDHYTVRILREFACACIDHNFRFAVRGAAPCQIDVVLGEEIFGHTDYYYQYLWKISSEAQAYNISKKKKCFLCLFYAHCDGLSPHLGQDVFIPHRLATRPFRKLNSTVEKRLSETKNVHRIARHHIERCNELGSRRRILYTYAQNKDVYVLEDRFTYYCYNFSITNYSYKEVIIAQKIIKSPVAMRLLGEMFSEMDIGTFSGYALTLQVDGCKIRESIYLFKSAICRRLYTKLHFLNKILESCEKFPDMIGIDFVDGELTGYKTYFSVVSEPLVSESLSFYVKNTDLKPIMDWVSLGTRYHPDLTPAGSKLEMHTYTRNVDARDYINKTFCVSLPAFPQFSISVALDFDNFGKYISNKVYSEARVSGGKYRSPPTLLSHSIEG